MWLLLSTLAAAGALGLLAAGFRFRTSAIIVVHPWNLGMTEAEVERSLRSIGITGENTASRSALIARHVEYYERLGRGLRRCFCRFVILVEQQEQQARSHECVSRLVRVPILDRFADKLAVRHRRAELFLRPRLVVLVDSRSGRATPQGGDWKTLYQTLRQIGIRRIYFAGCYLGVRGTELVDPKEEYYCINDAVFNAKASGLFKIAEPLIDYCYVHQVKSNPNKRKRCKKRRK